MLGQIQGHDKAGRRLQIAAMASLRAPLSKEEAAKQMDSAGCAIFFKKRQIPRHLLWAGRDPLPGQKLAEHATQEAPLLGLDPIDSSSSRSGELA